jgi:hypothetical protein
MIKTALKHYLYEFCINQMFNEFEKNLIIKNNVIKVGDIFESIIVQYPGRRRTTYFNAKIEVIDQFQIIISGPKCVEDFGVEPYRYIHATNYHGPVEKKEIISL